MINLYTVAKEFIDIRPGVFVGVAGAAYGKLAGLSVVRCAIASFIWGITEVALYRLRKKVTRSEGEGSELGLRIITELSITTAGISIFRKNNLIGEKMTGFIIGYRAAYLIKDILQMNRIFF